ncbi:MAG: 50S ribosomal protein L33 [Endomicrobium sp.]|jgi:large subunit ribosomal protein L33|nr:50S ribosomal protein L33 [Endomicrobium sp.]
MEVETLYQMSDKSIIVMSCTKCKSKNYYFSKSEKQTTKTKLVLQKFCKKCRKHTEHKTLK